MGLAALGRSIAALVICFATPAAAAPWVVVPQEPVCVLGTVFDNGVRFRLEYHPRSDTYHLTLGGEQWANASDGAPVAVRIGSRTTMRPYAGRIVRQDPELPGALYVPLTNSLQPSRVVAKSAGPNGFLEQLMTRRSTLRIEVDGRPVVDANSIAGRKGMSELARCSNGFVKGGKSGAAHRLLGNRLY